MNDQKTENRGKRAVGLKPSKTINPHTEDGRARRVVRFHLDISRDDDYELKKQFDSWKASREFLPMIRKALWLLISLMTGDTRLLMEYFPGIVASIREDATASLRAENAILRERIAGYEDEIEDSNAIIDAQDKELDILRKQKDTRLPVQDNSALEAKIDRLESLIISNGYRPEQVAEQPKTSPNSGLPGIKGQGIGNGGVGLKSNGIGLKGSGLGNVSTSALPPPLDDDDLPELSFTKAKPDGAKANLNLINGLLSLQGD